MIVSNGRVGYSFKLRRGEAINLLNGNLALLVNELRNN